jgi:hypothetical protein
MRGASCGRHRQVGNLATTRSKSRKSGSGSVCGDPRYAFAKLSEVVRVLATEPGNAIERIFLSRRILFRLRPNDFPSSLRKEFGAILAEIDKRRTPTGYRMIGRTASRLASRLLDLWHAIGEAIGQIGAGETGLATAKPSAIAVSCDPEAPWSRSSVRFCQYLARPRLPPRLGQFALRAGTPCAMTAIPPITIRGALSSEGASQSAPSASSMREFSGPLAAGTSLNADPAGAHLDSGDHFSLLASPGTS